MKRNLYVVFAFALAIALFSCDTGLQDRAQWWSHTFVASDATYYSASPHGFYLYEVYDSRIRSESWIDVWFVRPADGSLYRAAPQYDTDLFLWHDVVYLGNGALWFTDIVNLTGTSIVIFYHPAQQTS